jgi:hypothetical protein
VTRGDETGVTKVHAHRFRIYSRCLSDHVWPRASVNAPSKNGRFVPIGPYARTNQAFGWFRFEG